MVLYNRKLKSKRYYVKIDTSLSTIEKKNRVLKETLPDNCYSTLNLDVSKFAIAEGKSKGELYTSKSIVNLIAEMIEPYKDKVYDPAYGSGGVFGLE